MSPKTPEAARADAEQQPRLGEEGEVAAKLVRAEVETKKGAVQANTDRLPSLRLEKEAADKAKAAAVQAMAKSKGRNRDAHAAGKEPPGRSKMPK